MSFKIRKARIRDLEPIYGFICQLEKVIFNKNSFRRIFLKNLSAGNIFYYIAENTGKSSEKKIAGFISIYIQSELHHCAKVAEIMELFVDEKFRGREIGTALLDAALKTAGINNCDIIEVAANTKRKEAHRFYKKKNFKRTHFKFTMKL